MTDPIFSPVIPQKTADTASGRPAEDKGYRQQLRKTCSKFESIFIYYLLKEMRATIPKSDLMGGGYSEDTYTSMLDLQLSREIASKRGIGLSSLLFDQLSRRHVKMDEMKDKKDMDCNKVSPLLCR